MKIAFSKKTLVLVAVLLLGIVATLFLGWPWASITANFVYLMGVTQGLFALVILLWLLGVNWVETYVVPAGMIALSFAPMAFFVLLSLLSGEEEIFHWSRSPDHSTWFSSSAFFTRNLGTLIAFYAVVFYITKKHLQDQSRQPQRLVLLIILFVINQSVIALDFGMNLSPGWHNTLFAPYYWFGGLYAGLAILMSMVLVAKESTQTSQSANNMRRLLLAFSSIWAYLWWSQYLPIWYANLPEETEAFYSRFSGEFSVLSGLMFLFLFFIPFAVTLLSKGKGESLKPVLIIILLGSWIERYLIVVPPIRHLNADSATIPQHFTWLDGLTTVSFFACFLLLLTIGHRSFSKSRLGNQSG